MLKKVLLLVIILFSLTACSLKQDIQNNTEALKEDPSAMILYYSETCPHCKIVDKYIEENNIDSRLKITKKEVSESIENSSELAEKTYSCGLDTKNLGIPFLYYKSKCYMGDQDIIKLLENEIK